MRVSLVFATLLCFTAWKSSVHAMHAPLGNCPCMRWSNTKAQLNRIVNYTVQSEGVCEIAAIRFHTMLGKTICSDPNSGWAKRAKAKVDEESRKKAMQEHGRTEEWTTSAVPLTEATTSKKVMREDGPTEKGTTSAVPLTEATTSKKVMREDGPTEKGTTSAVPLTEATTSKKVMREDGPTEKGTTSAVPLTEAFKSTKAPKRTGRTGRKLLGRRSRKWKKSQLRRRG